MSEMGRTRSCDRPWCIGHDADGDHIPKRDHPTLHRCDEYVDGTIKCPCYLNHDGTGGVYCPDEARHVVSAPASPQSPTQPRGAK